MEIKIEACLLLCLLEFTTAQFTSSRRLPRTPCDLHGTSLVEQFFNVIFTEFQHSPPTCTCVQMCPDQPTFCYPNGCFRKTEKKRETSPVSRIQQDGSKTLFLFDDDRDIFADVEGENLMGSSLAVKAEQQPLESNLKGSFNPIKDIVFKYKKIPKMEIKYNLREQVKHTKDKKAEVDFSKTRWPINKQIIRNHKVNYQRSSNYLPSVFPETNQPEIPKYLRRYLTKRQSQNGLDVSALYLYKDASNFSLETLIDNLIEKGLDGVNSTLGLKITNSNISIDESNKSDPQFMNSVVEDLSLNMTRPVEHISNMTKPNDTNEDVVLKLIGNATRTKNECRFNKIVKFNNSTSRSYSEMITTLSKEIEKQNNVSMEVMENLTGKKVRDITETNFINLQELIDNRTENVAESLHKTTFKMSVEGGIKSTTNKIPTSLHKAFAPVINGQVKKSKQRIVRKLQNRKLN